MRVLCCMYNTNALRVWDDIQVRWEFTRRRIFLYIHSTIFSRSCKDARTAPPRESIRRDVDLIVKGLREPEVATLKHLFVSWFFSPPGGPATSLDDDDDEAPRTSSQIGPLFKSICMHVYMGMLRFMSFSTIQPYVSICAICSRRRRTALYIYIHRAD